MSVTVPESDPDARRLALMYVPREFVFFHLFAQPCAGKARVLTPTLYNLPAQSFGDRGVPIEVKWQNCKIVDVMADWHTGAFIFKLQSPQFNVVLPGQHIERLDFAIEERFVDIPAEAPPPQTLEQWHLERAATVTALRRVCSDYGYSDWPDDLHLADVIEKHLEQPLEGLLGAQDSDSDDGDDEGDEGLPTEPTEDTVSEKHGRVAMGLLSDRIKRGEATQQTYMNGEPFANGANGERIRLEINPNMNPCITEAVGDEKFPPIGLHENYIGAGHSYKAAVRAGRDEIVRGGTVYTGAAAATIREAEARFLNEEYISSWPSMTPRDAVAASAPESEPAPVAAPAAVTVPECTCPAQMLGSGNHTPDCPWMRAKQAQAPLQ